MRDPISSTTGQPIMTERRRAIVVGGAVDI